MHHPHYPWSFLFLPPHLLSASLLLLNWCSFSPCCKVSTMASISWHRSFTGYLSSNHWWHQRHSYLKLPSQESNFHLYEGVRPLMSVMMMLQTLELMMITLRTSLLHRELGIHNPHRIEVEANQDFSLFFFSFSLVIYLYFFIFFIFLYFYLYLYFFLFYFIVILFSCNYDNLISVI